MGLDLANKETSFACYNKNENIRLQSSSGGLFYLLARLIIERQGVVFGAVIDEQGRVYHDAIEKLEDLPQVMGSKYVQSEIGDAMIRAKSFLEEGRYVLFSGTPCQVAAMRNILLGKEYTQLLLVDVVCHGVPSPLIWNKYLKEKFGKSQYTDIYFREKANGWKNYNLLIRYENGEYKKRAYDDIYIRTFLNDLCLRPSCYQCQIKENAIKSDITLGDFWGIEKVLPEIDDDKGCSVAFANTQQGLAYWDLIKDNLVWKQIDATILKETNPSIAKPTEKPDNREEFLRMVENGKSIEYSALRCLEGPTWKRILRKGKGWVKGILR